MSARLRIVSALLLMVCSATVASGAPQDGAALYQKHCQGCHPDSARLRSNPKIVSVLRDPPSAMPIFSQEKLTGSDARALTDFIYQRVKVVVPRSPFDLDSDAPIKPVALLPANKGKLSGFVGKWAVKEMRFNAVRIVHTFELALNAGNELVVVSPAQSDEAGMRITSFAIDNATVRLEYKWRMKNASSYWRIDTYELAISNEVGKLKGKRIVRTSAWSETKDVWAEDPSAVTPPRITEPDRFPCPTSLMTTTKPTPTPARKK